MKILPPLLLALLPCVCRSQTTWTPRQAPTQNWEHSAAVPGRFLLTSHDPAGTSGLVHTATSADGVTWTAGTLPGHDVLVTDGALFLGCRVNGGFWTSADGVNIIRSADSQPVEIGVTSAVCGNGVWIMAGAGAALRSTDQGATWKAHSFPGLQPSAMFHDGAEFFALVAGVLLASADGITWTVRWEDAPYVLYQGRDTLFSGVRRSRDSGKTWTTFIPLNRPEIFTSGPIYSDRFLGVLDARVLTSADGVAWETAHSAQGERRFRTVCAIGGTAVAAGENGLVASAVYPPAPPPAGPAVRPMVELSCPTLPGRVYQPQSSPDKQEWKDDGPPATGDGGPLRFYRHAGEPALHFRIVIK